MRKFLLLSALFVCFSIAKSLAQCAIATSPISGNATVCPNSNNMTYSVTNNAGSTYAWTIMGGTPAASSTTNSITVNWGAGGGIGNYYVEVIETFSGGCIGNPVFLPIYFIGFWPQPTITGSTSTCMGSVGNYSVFNGPGTTSTYVWNIIGGFIPTPSGPSQTFTTTTNNVNVNWSVVGTGSISVTETNYIGSSCTVTASLPVNVQPSPVISAPSTQLCPGNTMTLSPASGGTWSSSNPSVATVSSTGVVTAVANGTASLIFTLPSGCSSSVPLTVGPPNNLFITGLPLVCPNGTNIYTVLSYSGLPVPAAPGTPAPGTFAWTITGGNQVSGGNTNTITVNWGPSGPGNVSAMEINSSLGCPGTPFNFPVRLVSSLITGSSNVCSSSTTSYSVTTNPPDLGATYTWSVTDGTVVGSPPPGIPAAAVQWGSAGSGSVSVVATSNGCSIPSNLPVTINAIPVTSAISGKSTVCPGASGVNYSVVNTPGSTYSWSISGGNTLVGIQAGGGNTNSITVNWSTWTGSTKVSVVETTAAGCVGAQVDFPVTITYPPTGWITGSNVGCINTQTGAYSVINTVGSTYAWTITGGTQTSGGNSNIITVNWGGSAGSGNVKVVETNSSGCVGVPVNLPVTIYAPNNTSAITGNSTICVNTNGVAYSVTNTAGSSYNWAITGGSVASGQGTSAITVNWTTAGAGNVKVVETNSAGCTGTAVNKSVTVNPLPVTSSITGPSPVCANMTGAVYSVTNTTGSTYAWTVTGTTGTSLVSGNGTNSIIVNWGVAGTGTVKVTETNVNLCVGAAMTKSVTINANPTTSPISGSASVCPNATGISYSVTNTLNSQYTWTITGGTQATGAKTNSITVNWGLTGGNVSVSETNAAGCVGTTMNKAVTASPITSAITGSVSVCPNSNGVAYSVANVTGDTYTWTATGGTVVCGQNTSTILVNWGVAGPGTLSVTERSATCTGVPVSLPVTINATPSTSVITGNSVVCSNASGVAYSVTNTSGSTYTWTVTGGTLVSGAGTNNITINWGIAGTGSISVIETSSTGCVGAAVNKIVTITSVNTGIISGNSSMCLPANGISYSVPNTAGSTYAWSINGGTQASGGTTSSITVNWGPAGPGSVNVQETNSAGCVGNTITESVLVNPRPLTGSISGNVAACANTGASYSVTNTTGSTYLWTITGGTQVIGGTTNGITVNWGAAGAGSVSVVETNYLGCVGAMVSLPVAINAKPVVSISASSYSICSGSSSTLTASGASSYSWSTGASSAVITVSPSSTTTYTVTGTTNGCSSTASVTITVGSGYGYVSPSSVDLCTTGGCTTLQAGSGTNYVWSTGSTSSSISVCSVGTYTVRYTVNGCNVSASANVYQGSSNQPPIQAGVDPVIGTQKVEVKDKSTAIVFTQATESVGSSVPKDVNHIDTAVPCGALPQAQQSTQSEKENTSFSIYPNPAFTQATVVLSKTATEDSPVLWFDMSGRQVKTSTIEKGNKEKTFQIDELDAGVYLVRVKDNGQLRYSKIIVSK